MQIQFTTPTILPVPMQFKGEDADEDDDEEWDDEEWEDDESDFEDE